MNTENPTTTDTPTTPPETQTDPKDARIQFLENREKELIYALAEFQNSNKEMQKLMRRNEQETEAKLKFASEKLLLDLLSALDNLDRAVQAAKQAGDNSPLTIGVIATQSQFLDILKKHGVQPIESLGQPFDPNLHQAVKQVPVTEGVESNSIVEVFQAGFRLHDRVLRPALVAVAQ